MPQLTIRQLSSEINSIIDSTRPEIQDALRKRLFTLLLKSLSPTQFRIYHILDQRPDLTAAVIGALMGKEQNYISNELTKLMEYGLVERSPIVQGQRGLQYHWRTRSF